jgi:uncharacterized protein YqeY
MDTKQKLQEDLKQSMRAGDEPRKRNIRMVLAATRLAEVEKGSPLDEPGLMVILQKEIKSRRETILDAQKIGRSDLVDVAEVDISILESYLPKPLTQEELVTQGHESPPSPFAWPSAWRPGQPCRSTASVKCLIHDPIPCRPDALGLQSQPPTVQSRIVAAD